jgi:CheY-like chemotaxis protein
MIANTPSLRPVLYVEDNETDLTFLKRALTKIHSSLPMQVITDGRVAWDFLTGKGPTSRPPVPSLILLDLKLPHKSGLEILALIKSHDDLRRVPVIVLTTSTNPEDIDRAYALGADFYFVKRPSFGGCVELARAIDAYWTAVREGAEHLGADPTLHRLRKLAETPRPCLDETAATR